MPAPAVGGTGQDASGTQPNVADATQVRVLLAETPQGAFPVSGSHTAWDGRTSCFSGYNRGDAHHEKQAAFAMGSAVGRDDHIEWRALLPEFRIGLRRIQKALHAIEVAP